MQDHGLSDKELEVIKQILRPFADKIEKVGLFGSRATGKFRKNSDIDMVIYGSITQADIDRLWTLFDSSSLVLKVDLNAYHLIAYPPLKEHIDKVMRPLFSKEELVYSHYRAL